MFSATLEKEDRILDEENTFATLRLLWQRGRVDKLLAKEVADESCESLGT